MQWPLYAPGATMQFPPIRLVEQEGHFSVWKTGACSRSRRPVSRFRSAWQLKMRSRASGSANSLQQRPRHGGAVHHGATMKQKTLLEVLAEDQSSVDAVLGVIAELCGELQQGQVEDW